MRASFYQKAFARRAESPPPALHVLLLRHVNYISKYTSPKQQNITWYTLCTILYIMGSAFGPRAHRCCCIKYQHNIILNALKRVSSLGDIDCYCRAISLLRSVYSWYGRSPLHSTPARRDPCTRRCDALLLPPCRDRTPTYKGTRGPGLGGSPLSRSSSSAPSPASSTLSAPFYIMHGGARTCHV